MNEKSAIDEPNSTADESAWERWRNLTCEAYARFHDNLLSNRSHFPCLASFDVLDRVRATRGTFAWWWGSEGEVRETINTLNAWGVRLHEWNSWNLVIDSYELEDDKWEVLYHFVEPIAFFCMLQPSSLADRLIVASETLLHQANPFVFADEDDYLDQDNLPPGKTLRRSDRLKQLARLGKRWAKFDAFREALSAINGKDYRRVTGNFRDLSAHSFAPRLMIGQVVRAIRAIVPRTEIVSQPDGTYLPVQNSRKKSVSYAAHAASPLDLKTSRSANLAEYQNALAAMQAFSSLIYELCDRMDSIPERTA